jgi:predicted Fe-Mo cluster-binding NifX family protein
MKIAIASFDGRTISPHFGRSKFFIVFDIKDGVVAGKEVRQNTVTAHAQGLCEGAHQQDHHHHHSHSAIVEALRDYDAVLCRGMGWRAAQDLAANNIKAYILDSECTPEEAATRFACGDPTVSGEFCRCHDG